MSMVEIASKHIMYDDKNRKENEIYKYLRRK